jgi:leucyl aminopeptidase
MKISFRKSFSGKEQVVLIPYFTDYKNVPKAYAEWIKERENSKDISEKKGASIEHYPGAKNSPRRLVFYCFGEEEKIQSKDIRGGIARALKQIRKNAVPEVGIVLNGQFLKYSQGIGEAIALSNYNKSLFKTGKVKKEEAGKMIKKVIIISSDADRIQKYDLNEGVKIGLAVNEVRDLVNSPHNVVNVETMVKKAEEICKENQIKYKVLDKKQLEKLKMGALLAVNEGSKDEARMVMMEYLPLGKRQEPIVLVGKGVMFDTGGINIKPSNGLSEMHMDMAGSAAVLGVFMLLKELEIQQNVIGIIPLTDNSVGSRSQKPSDVITSFSGKTIEVGNTDAEGRLIIIDAISYAIQTYKPSAIVDIATLTGACMVALGDQMAGMWGNNEKMKDRMRNAALETDEEVWEMPIHAVHREGMKGKFADLNNIDVPTAGLAGACTAAAFIENFIEKTDWIHLDIAGPAFPKKSKDVDFPGATGFGVRLLTRFLQNIK